MRRTAFDLAVQFARFLRCGILRLRNRMAHPLDRPVWNALTTRQAHLAEGDDRAWRIHAEYGLFAASHDLSSGNLAALAALIPDGGTIGIAETMPVIPPPGTMLAMQMDLHQMIAREIVAGEAGFEVTALGDADAEEMLALATLTEPGPFFRRTHQLGDFVGVRATGKLVAMAGERLKLTGYTEVSGVCTHPDHRGKGYAGGLMRIVAQRIAARGETPFLHVLATNGGAIALYENLGFRYRRDITLTVLGRAP
jgi:predicted GNAT family acetyltransferase